MCTSTSATPPEASGTIAGEARAPGGAAGALYSWRPLKCSTLPPEGGALSN